MSEITKLYENAGVELRKCSECDNNMDCGYGKGCYPPFTAEKLINLVMFLINKGDFDIKKGSVDITFCIAGLINNLWQDLTAEEKQQVKGILEE